MDLVGEGEVDLDNHRRKDILLCLLISYINNNNHNKFMEFNDIDMCCYEYVNGFVENSHCLTHSMCLALVCFRRSLAVVLSTLSSVEKISGCGYAI